MHAKLQRRRNDHINAFYSGLVNDWVWYHDQFNVAQANILEYNTVYVFVSHCVWLLQLNAPCVSVFYKHFFEWHNPKWWWWRRSVRDGSRDGQCILFFQLHLKPVYTCLNTAFKMIFATSYSPHFVIQIIPTANIYSCIAKGRTNRKYSCYATSLKEWPKSRMKLWGWRMANKSKTVSWPAWLCLTGIKAKKDWRKPFQYLITCCSRRMKVNLILATT